MYEKGHGSAILHHLADLRGHSRYCDVLLQNCESSALCHRCIISFSPKIDELIRCEPPNTILTVKLPDRFNSHVVTGFLDWLYTGCISFDQIDIQSILDIAAYFECFQLISECHLYAKSNSILVESNKDISCFSPLLVTATVVDGESCGKLDVVPSDEVQVTDNSVSSDYNLQKFLKTKSCSTKEQLFFSSEYEHIDQTNKTEKCKKKRKHRKSNKQPTQGSKYIFQCPSCPATFQWSYLLNRHKQGVHQNVRPHQCKICPRSFGRKEQLAAHLTSHSGAREFPCKLCDKRFRHNSSLYVHMKTHSECSYVCEICGRSSHSKVSLRRHVETHSNDTPFQCQYCEKLFKLQRYLRRHERQHEVETVANRSDTKTTDCMKQKEKHSKLPNQAITSRSSGAASHQAKAQDQSTFLYPVALQVQNSVNIPVASQGD